jgi:hypothetical protein
LVVFDKYLYYNRKTVDWTSYCLIIINKAALTAHPDYHWHTLAFDFTYSQYFGVAGTNLGIPDSFSTRNGFDGNCLAGITKLGIL